MIKTSSRQCALFRNVDSIIVTLCSKCETSFLKFLYSRNWDYLKKIFEFNLLNFKLAVFFSEEKKGIFNVPEKLLLTKYCTFLQN